MRSIETLSEKPLKPSEIIDGNIVINMQNYYDIEDKPWFWNTPKASSCAKKTEGETTQSYTHITHKAGGIADSQPTGDKD